MLSLRHLTLLAISATAASSVVALVMRRVMQARRTQRVAMPTREQPPRLRQERAFLPTLLWRSRRKRGHAKLRTDPAEGGVAVTSLS